MIMHKKIAIVGGGSAGLISALILKTKFPSWDIDLIRSEKIGIIGVGEGSTEHWTTFMDYVGIHYFDLVRECDATFKSGIMFQNWAEEDYLQSIAGRYSQLKDHYPFVYAKLISENVHPKKMLSSQAWESKVNTWFISNQGSCPVLQFHFNTYKLNEFLTNLAKDRGIVFYDDEIHDITFKSSGDIDTIIGDKKIYQYDFYIDSTGFRRILIGKLGAKWRSYSDCLKMKSAIMFASEMKEQIPMWTAARAMDYGWMFSIPTYGRTGNGYIFDSNYISKDQAHEEIENHLGKSVDIVKNIEFDPGALETPWIRNCCTIGLSASFVEPLEASSIGTSIQQSFLLSDLILDYTDSCIIKYNKIMSGILDNIRDFIFIHYLTEKTNTQFWIDARNSNVPGSLQNKLELWKTKLPTSQDFCDVSSYRLFSELHHTLVLYGLNYFDTSKIKTEYDFAVDYHSKLRAEEAIRDEETLECQTIPHKVMIELIRNMTHENKR